jgi:hypothetical protein
MAFVTRPKGVACLALLSVAWLAACRGIVGTEEKQYVGACVASTTECPPGFADCDGCSDNGCEVDVGRDDGNCGRCERACSSTSCNAGMCSPEVLSTHDFGGIVYRLGIDDTNVYVPGPITLLVMPKAGGTPSPLLAEDTGEVGDVTAHGGSIYYASLFLGKVYVTTPLGPPATTLVEFPPVEGSHPHFNSLRVDDEHVYVASHIANGFLARFPVGGGAPTTLSSGSTHFHTALDETSVYVEAGNAVKRIDKLTTEASIVVSDVDEFTVDDTHVYYTTAAGDLARIPKLGGPVELVTSDTSMKTGVHVDETRIYWRSASTIQATRKDGSQSHPDTLATDQAYTQSDTMQLDESYVYWIGKNNWLYRTPK